MRRNERHLTDVDHDFCLVRCLIFFVSRETDICAESDILIVRGVPCTRLIRVSLLLGVVTPLAHLLDVILHAGVLTLGHVFVPLLLMEDQLGLPFVHRCLFALDDALLPLLVVTNHIVIILAVVAMVEGRDRRGYLCLIFKGFREN